MPEKTLNEINSLAARPDDEMSARADTPDAAIRPARVLGLRR